MRVEQERGYTQCQNRDPEIDNFGDPNCQRDVEQHDERSHSEVDAGTCKPRVQNTEVDATRGETTSRGNVSGTTKCEIADDRVTVNLGGEHFEDRRQRRKLLGKS